MLSGYNNAPMYQSTHWFPRISVVFLLVFLGITVPVRFSHAVESVVLGDFTIPLSSDWVRAEKTDEEEQQNYLMAYKPGENPEGSYPIFMIQYKVDEYRNEDEVKNFLSAYAAKWLRDHPGTKAVRTQVAGTNAVLAHKNTPDGDTLFPVMIGKGTRLYTAAFIIPGPSAVLPPPAQELLNGLRFTEDIQRVSRTVPESSEPRGRELVRKIAPSVLAFRQLAQEGFGFALQKYASPFVRDKFGKFDEALWPVTNAEMGWSFFFNTALVCFGMPLPSGELPVVFYHPWSDVLLISIWHEQTGIKIEMNDAEVLMGDFLRKDGHPQFDTRPLWLRQGKISAVTAGLAAAETLAAFEKKFRNRSLSSGNWRDTVPNLRGGRTLESNYYGAGVLLTDNLRGLVDATSDETGNIYRPAIRRVLNRLREAKIPELVSEAKGTLPEAAELLLRIPTEEFLIYRIAAFAVSGGQGLLMLTKGDDPDIYMALTLGVSGETVDRIDLLGFQGIYQEWLARKVSGDRTSKGGPR